VPANILNIVTTTMYLVTSYTKTTQLNYSTTSHYKSVLILKLLAFCQIHVL